MQFTLSIIVQLLLYLNRKNMQSNTRISTRRHVRESAPCQEINNVFNQLKIEVKTIIEEDNFVLTKLPTTNKITCQMIQNMQEYKVPSKQNQQQCLVNMKKIFTYQKNLFIKHFNKEDIAQTYFETLVQPELVMDIQDQNQYLFTSMSMRDRLMNKVDAKKDHTKDMEEMEEEDILILNDKIRKQLDNYLTIN